MDLSNLYSSIEEMEDKVDKCLLYSEIILYLKDVNIAKLYYILKMLLLVLDLKILGYNGKI